MSIEHRMSRIEVSMVDTVFLGLRLSLLDPVFK
jgi:hypothetical protein